MEDLFKTFINAGVGFIAQGNKKVQSTIEKLVQESKISEQEGKKIVDELMKSSETKVRELETQFKGLTDSMMKTVGLGQKSAKTSKSGASKPATSNKSGGASGAAKTANSAVSKTAGAVKKAADSVSKSASTAQHSAAAKSGAAKKPAAKKAAPASQSGEQKGNDKKD